MSTLAHVALVLALLAEPLLVLAVGVRERLRTRRGQPSRAVVVDADVVPVGDLTVVVPVHGDVRDLDRLEGVHGLGDRVLLVTTAHEARDFSRRLWSVAGRYGFRVHVVGAGRRGDPAPSGATRTALLRAAHDVLTSRYVVCLDPGTRLPCAPEHLVGAALAAGVDLATVDTARPVPVALTRWSRVGDVLAARLRPDAPWWVRGGVHVARSAVHLDLLERHTGFGPGDDAELAVLAAARGHRVGHVAAAAAAGPLTWRTWWAQQVRDAAGVFRLGVVNGHLGVRYPSLHLGAAAAAFAAVPLVWWGVWCVPGLVACALLVHGLLAVVLARDPAGWLHAVLALVRTALVLPAGAVLHAVTAARSGRAGVLRAGDAWLPTGPDVAPVVRRLPGPGAARATDWWARR